jgi:hypothetical protein
MFIASFLGLAVAHLGIPHTDIWTPRSTATGEEERIFRPCQKTSYIDERLLRLHRIPDPPGRHTSTIRHLFRNLRRYSSLVVVIDMGP